MHVTGTTGVGRVPVDSPGTVSAEVGGITISVVSPGISPLVMTGTGTVAGRVIIV